MPYVGVNEKLTKMIYAYFPTWNKKLTIDLKIDRIRASINLPRDSMTA